MKQVVILLIVLSGFSVIGQEKLTIAESYYKQGEYEKAVLYYEQVYTNKSQHQIFENYFDALLRADRMNDAEDLIKKRLTKEKNNPSMYVLYGGLKDLQKDTAAARSYYDKAIYMSSSSGGAAVGLAKTFYNKGLMKESLKCYYIARDLYGPNYPLNFQIGEILGILGDTEGMIDEFLEALKLSSSYQNVSKRYLELFIDWETENSQDVLYLKRALLLKLRASYNEVYDDLYLWTLLRTKDFNAAYLHLVSLDRKKSLEGAKLIWLASNALQVSAYDAANRSYDYVIGLGSNKLFYQQAVEGKLNIGYTEVMLGDISDSAAVDSILLSYEVFLKTDESATVEVKLNYYDLLLSQREVSDSLESELKKGIASNTYKPMDQAKAKMLLAKIYTVKGEIWEASLLYSQVEQDYKEDILGQEAKFNNAKLFYYAGNFDWAKDQLKVLKASTSKLIANNALELSVFLTETLGMDTSDAHLKAYSKAELLKEQKRYDQSLALLDSLIHAFPGSVILDDAYFLKAEIFIAQKKYVEAEEMLKSIVEDFALDVKGDDACFLLAELYRLHLLDKERALEYYQKVMTDYAGSLYVTRARRLYRQLKTETIE